MKALAQQLYEAYCDSAGWVSKFTGKSLPPWAKVDLDIQAHWIKVAETARDWAEEDIDRRIKESEGESDW